MIKTNPTKKPINKKAPSKNSDTKKTTVKSTKSKRTLANKKVSKNNKAIISKNASVIAKIDVGFGNELFIRGESGGLSWEKGLPMNCKANDEWHWESSSIKKPTSFKLLINDSEWSVGENETVTPSATCNTTPSF